MSTPLKEIEAQLKQREQTLLMDEIEKQLSAREKELSKSENFGSAFAETAVRGLFDNVLSTPDILPEGGPAMMTPAGPAPSTVGLDPSMFSTDLNEVVAGGLAIPEALTPQRSGQVIPVPGFGMTGTINPFANFSERVGSKFDEELGRLDVEEQALRLREPKATGFGDVGGDVLTALTGRLPFSKSIARAESAILAKTFAESVTKPGTQRLLEQAFDSSAVRKLVRGAGRAGEAGVEGAILATLNDSDPQTVAAVAAGGQMAGSALLSTLKFGKNHPILSSAFGMAALIQLGAETIPGGSDSFIKSIEAGFEKVWWGIIAGATATAVGTGRFRGRNLAENWPRFTDAVAAIPRTSMISLISDYNKANPEEQQTINQVLQQLQQDPEFFGPEITEKLQQGFENGNLLELLREEL